MKTHQAEMRRRLREVTLLPADRDHFARLDRPVYALVMTEDWCGDSLMNLPIMARLVKAAPGMELRIFDRAGSPDLNDYYTARNIKAIPVFFTFLDADFDEIGTWVERSQAAYARVGEWMAAHPQVGELLQNMDMTAEERHHALQEQFGDLLLEMEAGTPTACKRRRSPNSKRCCCGSDAERLARSVRSSARVELLLLSLEHPA